MDKRLSKFLVGSILCMCILGCLLFIVYKFTFNSCELIHIEPQHLRNLTNWQKSRPLRTKDKSTLIKISAYLEYNMRTDKDDKRDFKEFKLQQMQQSASQFSPQETSQPPANNNNNNNNNNQLNNGQLPAGAPSAPIAGNSAQVAAAPANKNNLPVAAQTGNRHPIPSIPQTEFTSSQLQNNSYQHQNGSHQMHAQPIGLNLLTNGRNEKEERFLPLELDKVEVRKQQQDLFKYTLTFNCSTVTMIFKREPHQVSVQKISVELKVENKKKSKCEIDLNGRPSLFNVSVQNGFARYYCERELRFSCTNYASKDTSKPGKLLAQLVINGIEFETGNNTTPIEHHNHDFQGVRKTCGPNDI